MISVNQKGDFSSLTNFLQKAKNALKIRTLEQYGEKGVAALSAATPKDSGETAASWQYKVNVTDTTASLTFYNSNVVNYVPIAIILQYGHATKNGGWVEGRDYINPAIQPIFDKLADDVWREVTK